jgi:hypothetical protein
VLVPSDDPLYARLAASASRLPNLRLLPARCSAPAGDLATSRRIARAAARAPILAIAAREASCVLDVLDAVVPRTPAGPHVRTVTLDHGVTTIELDQAPERPVPIWVRQSFHPRWQVAGEPVYLATPTFQLVFARTQTTVLSTSGSRGGTATVLALLGLLAVAVVATWPRIGARWKRRALTLAVDR